MLQSDSETEIETIEQQEKRTKVIININQEEDIRKRIEVVVDAVQKFERTYVETRTTVKKQLEELVDLGINKYKMEPMHLRDLIVEAFKERDVSLRHLRRLLPDVLKYTSRTPLTTIQRQKLKQQQQAQALQLRKQEIRPEVSIINSESTEVRAEALSPTVMQTTATEVSYTMAQEPDTGALKEKLRMAHAQIKRLEDMLQDVGKPFTKNAFLKRKGYLIPIIVTIDPLKKAIISVQAKW